jgi:Flp pilus assembly protein TadD
MSHHRKAKIHALILALLIFIAPRVVSSQEEEEESARLSGKIVNVEKKPLENAVINFKNTALGTVVSAKSSKKGEFSFARLAAGKYEVTIQKEGFKTYTGQTELQAGSSPKVTITLAVELTPEQKNAADALAAFGRGTELFREKKTDEALQEFQKAIDLKPDFVEAYINKGILLFQNMKDEEAEKAILKALEFKPEEAKAKEILANIYFEQSKALLQNDKFDAALEKLKVVYNMRPDYPYLNFLLGYAYNKKGMKEDAIEYFELFLQQEPNSPQAGQVKALLEELKKK